MEVWVRSRPLLTPKTHWKRRVPSSEPARASKGSPGHTARGGRILRGRVSP